MPESNRKTVHLVMPGYGTMTSGAAIGFMRASAGGLDVSLHYSAGSLLAHNFNALWCGALTAKHRGAPVDYFAMQHDDIEPEPFWLDKLVAELEEKDLDVLGVVSPIKDQQGLTSIALHDPEGDDWHPKCRLTMREIYQLPETFTSEDVGYPLLLNTGLWVCRFNPEWASQLHFTINDRIVFNREKDCYMAEVESEDWFFSRCCHDLGLKIGVTRKIALNHKGSICFSNSHPWGTESFDKMLLQSSVIPSIRDFPSDVEGWLLPQEGEALSRLAAGKNVLEIGSYCGRSTVCLARTAKHVVAIDPHDGRGTPNPKATRQIMEANLTRYGLREKVDIYQTTINGLDYPDRFDLVFIDGAHDIDSVRNDMAHAMQMLAPDGLLAFHDYRLTPGEHDGGWDPGVTDAVNELVAEGGEIVSRHATLAVVRPPAKVLLEN